MKAVPQLAVDVEIVRGHFSGSWAVVFARRISGPHREFLGVVTRALPPETLESFFVSVGLGSHASISLRHRDGASLAEYPHVRALIGQNFKTGPADQQAVFARPSLSTRLMGSVDGKDRLIASRKLVTIR